MKLCNVATTVLALPIAWAAAQDPFLLMGYKENIEGVGTEKDLGNGYKLRLNSGYDCIYDNARLMLIHGNNIVSWQSGNIYGDCAFGYFARLQGDCNLIIWEGIPSWRDSPLWKSESSQHEEVEGGCIFVAKPGESKVAIVKGQSLSNMGDTLWEEFADFSPAPPKQDPVTLVNFLETIESPKTVDDYTLTLETTGNLKLESADGLLLWESGRTGYPPSVTDYYARLQGDCNFLVKQGSPENKGYTIWKTKTEQWSTPVDPCQFIYMPDLKRVAIVQGSKNLWERNAAP